MAIYKLYVPANSSYMTRKYVSRKWLQEKLNDTPRWGWLDAKVKWEVNGVKGVSIVTFDKYTREQTVVPPIPEEVEMSTYQIVVKVEGEVHTIKGLTFDQATQVEAMVSMVAAEVGGVWMESYEVWSIETAGGTDSCVVETLVKEDE